jgi:hypothetical protein
MKSLDKLARPIMRPAFEQYGFAHAELVAQWTAIVGEDIAEKCSPERLTWPNGRDSAKRQSEGATLAVRADHGAGLALSYETQGIIDRINGFFGYMAVTKIKIVQGNRAARHTPRPPQTINPTPDTIDKVDGKTGTIEDGGLKNALTRLGQAALSKAQQTN